MCSEFTNPITWLPSGPLGYERMNWSSKEMPFNFMARTFWTVSSSRLRTRIQADVMRLATEFLGQRFHIRLQQWREFFRDRGGLRCGDRRICSDDAHGQTVGEQITVRIQDRATATLLMDNLLAIRLAKALSSLCCRMCKSKKSETKRQKHRRQCADDDQRPAFLWCQSHRFASVFGCEPSVCCWN